MADFNERLALATDETTQVQPLYRQELFNAVKHSDTVEVDGVFASNGKLVQNHIMRVARVFENGKYREAKLEDIAVGKTDGIFNLEYYKVDGKDSKYVGFVTLLECKLDQDFNDRLYRSTVILQVICYLKQLKEQGEVVPEVSLVGSKKNCFVLRGKYIEKYIDMDIQHYKAASTAYNYNTEIMNMLNSDEELQNNCYVYTIDKDFKMSNVVTDIYNYVTGNDGNRKLTDALIAKAFDVFSMQILAHPEKVEPRKQAKYFLAIVLTPDDCFVSPKKPNKMVIGADIIDIVGEKYLSFREQFGMERGYTLEEQRRFTATADRLIEDADRRRRGDFYTPTVWVDEAHKMISKHLGNNWRNEYMVWDCCWGTGNLTRDYKFKDLYASTLIESDLTLAEKYNTNATKFQYDFLNDDVEVFAELAKVKEERGYLTVADFMERDVQLYHKAPGLINGLLEGKKLLFLINPPYATSGEMSSAATGKEKKTGVSVTKINELMKINNMGGSSQQLYAQFIYRILRFKELFENSIVLGIFSPTLLLCGLTFVTLTNELNRLLPYTCGFVLCASEFANVKSNWGISFTFWGAVDKANDFKTQVMQFNADNMSVISTQTKNYRAVTSDISASDWCKSGTKDKDIKYYLAPQFTSALQYKEKGTGKWCEDALGYIFTAAANKVEFNNQFCSLFTAPFANAHGWVLREVNFVNTVTYFVARRLITGPYATWINCKDEYMIPNTNHQDYAQFEADSIVYSLFNNSSNQSSLRDITYNNKQWDIKNEFFWLSRDEMKALAQGKYDKDDMNVDVEQDLFDNADDERYVYKELQKVTLSVDAKAVLDKATDLIKKSFKYRKTVNAVHSEYHLNTWDMGYYQLNKLVQEIPTLADDWKEFRALYKALEDRMRPLVYELGFLYE